jgi:thiol peroxidase
MKKFLIAAMTIFLIFSCAKDKEAAETGENSEIKEAAVQKEETRKVPENEKITVDGKEVTIENKRIKVGDKLEDAELIAPVNEFNKMKKVKLSDDKGIKLIYTAPSLDTPVCSLQTKMLDEKAKEHADVFFYSVTDDLPFAMMRFCSDNGIANLKTLSDFQTHDFSTKNGFLMKEYQLLTRAVIIVDENNVVKYVDYGKEVTDQLDLGKAIDFLEKEMLKK